MQYILATMILILLILIGGGISNIIIKNNKNSNIGISIVLFLSGYGFASIVVEILHKIFVK